MKKALLSLTVVALAATAASAAPTMLTTHSTDVHAFDVAIPATDLISGLTGTELMNADPAMSVPATAWHGAISDPLDKLPALNDDGGIRPTGLTGLLSDTPGAAPYEYAMKVVQYDLAAAADIGKIQILTGNNGADGRVFSTTIISYSTDNGANFQDLGYFQSDPSGTSNTFGWKSTLVEITDDLSATLLAGVTNIQFHMFAVDNTQNQNRDPYPGINPYTGVDDGLTSPQASPLVFELDVIAVPEPASLALLALGGLAVLRRR